jgi:hypothetical protein
MLSILLKRLSEYKNRDLTKIPLFGIITRVSLVQHSPSTNDR